MSTEQGAPAAYLPVGDWNIVSWGADRHDSLEYAIHRRFDDHDVVISVLVTEVDDGTHLNSEVWVYGTTENFHEPLEDSHLDGSPDSQTVVDLLNRGISTWQIALDPSKLSLTTHEVSESAVALVRNQSVSVGLAGHGTGLPRGVQAVMHQLAVEHIHQGATARLQKMGEELTEKLAPLERKSASFEPKPVQESEHRHVLKVLVRKYSDFFLDRGLAGVTLAMSFVMQGLLAWVSFTSVLASVDMSIALIGSVVGAISYACAITLCASQAGTRWDRGRYVRAVVLGTFAFAVLPLVISINTVALVNVTTATVDRSSVINVAVLAISSASAIATAVAAPLSERPQPLFNPEAAKERRQLRELKAHRVELLRRYASHADVVIAQTRQEVIAYLQHTVASVDDVSWIQPFVNWRPQCEWLDSARAELFQHGQRS